MLQIKSMFVQIEWIFTVIRAAIYFKFVRMYRTGKSLDYYNEIVFCYCRSWKKNIARAFTTSGEEASTHAPNRPITLVSTGTSSGYEKVTTFFSARARNTTQTQAIRVSVCVSVSVRVLHEYGIQYEIRNLYGKSLYRWMWSKYVFVDFVSAQRWLLQWTDCKWILDIEFFSIFLLFLKKMHNAIAELNPMLF